MSGSGSGSGSGTGGVPADDWRGYEPPLFLPPWLESPEALLWRTAQATAWAREEGQRGKEGSGSGSGRNGVDDVLRADFVGGPALTVTAGAPVYLLARVRGRVDPCTLGWTITHELSGASEYYPLARPTVWLWQEGVYAVILHVQNGDGRTVTVSKASYLWVKVAV